MNTVGNDQKWNYKIGQTMIFDLTLGIDIGTGIELGRILDYSKPGWFLVGTRIFDVPLEILNLG